MKIANKSIGPGNPCFIIAEISANHNKCLESALELIQLAKDSGADAVKIQTYTPDTLTLDCDSEYFQIGKGTLWAGRNLYDLYSSAFTPWEWHEALFAKAAELDVLLFSTPFDESAVELLEKFSPPAYKVASFELIDHGLLKHIASTGRPVIMSTGMASLAEIDEAVAVLRENGCRDLALLKCTSAYPAEPEDINLRTISHLSEAFCVPSGLSDHTLGIAVPVASVALGGSIIEKHFTKSRADRSPDSAFSLEPTEFSAMVEAVRVAEKAIGKVSYKPTEKEMSSRVFRRSLFVVENIKAGDKFSMSNVRSIRPSMGLAPKYLPQVLGKTCKIDVQRGTPVDWSMLGE